GRKIILAFQGIGPFTTKMGEWCARYAVRRAAFISVRDALSFERIKGWQKNTEVVQTCDPVISLIKAKIQSTDTKNVLAIIPRGNSTGTFTAKALEEVHSKNWNRIIIISMQGSDRSENKYCLSLAKLSEGRIMKVKTMDELVSAVGCASKVISQRYHGALAAKIMGKEIDVIKQSENDKLESVETFDSAGAFTLLSAGEESLAKALSAKLNV
ncbi:TPA: polysaccharide pyruvyl transferase family protein, partial [Candidatus Micrarchaeota archaeon]|nr:polysaccharide pyruvyl transferase family protein [Candidatus Micrarchaeota archaeon]